LNSGGDMMHFVSTWKGAIAGYGLLFFVLMSPYLVLGEVVAPHRQAMEMGATEAPQNDPHTENRKFNDFALGYIPAMSEQMNAPRSGWLALWTNQNELGRPLAQITGLGGAYPPSWLLMQVTGDPWRFITILSLSTCFLAGLFVLLFCRELGLSPLAGFTAGISLAASPLFMYWLTFPMFPAVWCWAAGALLGLIRLTRRASLADWSLLAFCAYSGLMTAYPQPLVFHAYLLAGYGLFLAYRKREAGWPAAARFLAMAGSAVLIGGALALPVYLDIARIASESARVAPDISFFTATLPSITSLGEAVRLLVLSTTPEIFGNPIATGYPFPYDGVSVTLVVAFLCTVALLSRPGPTAGWWLCVVVAILFGVITPLYEVGVRFLGFNVSRSTPLGTVMLPLMIIAAYGVDALTQRSGGPKPFVIGATVAGLSAIIGLGIAYGLLQSVEIRWMQILAFIAMGALLAAQFLRPRPVLVVLALILVLLTVSRPLLLRQDPAHIATTSPLIDQIRASLPAGSRFAVASPGISALPPNLNATLQLPSIHSYNSLSSRLYQHLIAELGGEVKTYGRWNAMIAPDYESAAFWMSNIGLVLAPNRLQDPNLDYLGSASDVHLHKVIARMGDSIQIETADPEKQIIDPRLYRRLVSSRLSDMGDLLEFKVTSGAPSLLILSQTFDRAWEASAFDGSGWAPARTIVVNGTFQGIVLAPEAQLVTLQFKPYARFAWIAHAFWLILLAGMGAQAAWRMSRFRANKAASL
jgi:hypothetical protein